MVADAMQQTCYTVLDVIPYKGCWCVLYPRSANEAITRHPHRRDALAKAESWSHDKDTIILVRNENQQTDQIVVYKRGIEAVEVKIEPLFYGRRG